MSQGQRSTLLAYLRRFVGTTATDSSDAELLERFPAERDEEACEALLQRHEPLVRSICRRVLGEEHAAENALSPETARTRWSAWRRCGPCRRFRSGERATAG